MLVVRARGAEFELSLVVVVRDPGQEGARPVGYGLWTGVGGWGQGAKGTALAQYAVGGSTEDGLGTRGYGVGRQKSLPCSPATPHTRHKAPCRLKAAPAESLRTAAYCFSCPRTHYPLATCNLQHLAPLPPQPAQQGKGGTLHVPSVCVRLPATMTMAEETQVLVKFFTRLPANLRVPEAPVVRRLEAHVRQPTGGKLLPPQV